MTSASHRRSGTSHHLVDAAKNSITINSCLDATAAKGRCNHIEKASFPMESKTFKCPPCGLSFKDVNQFKQHYESSHTLTFACDLCALPFTHKSQLFKHRQRLHGIIQEDQNEYLMNCIYCPKAYNKKTHLEEHINSVHFGIRYICDRPKCDKQFTRERYLKTHLKKVHFVESSPVVDPNDANKENVPNVPTVQNPWLNHPISEPPAKRAKKDEITPAIAFMDQPRTISEEEFKKYEEVFNTFYNVTGV